jgi:hypothetical protein
MKRFVKFLWEDTLVFFLTGAVLILVIWAFVLWSGVAQAAEDTCRIQSKLAELGYYRGEVDCQFGEGTRSALRRFQRDNGLNVDGVAGEDTRLRLFRGEEADQEDASRGEEGGSDEGRGRDSERRAAVDSQCSDIEVEASVMRATESRGKSGAVKAWQAEVLRRDGDGLGLSWNSWIAAADSSLKCKEIASWQWNCQAKARPCKDQ